MIVTVQTYSYIYANIGLLSQNLCEMYHFTGETSQILRI